MLQTLDNTHDWQYDAANSLLYATLRNLTDFAILAASAAVQAAWQSREACHGDSNKSAL
jgi:hypothetical protein